VHGRAGSINLKLSDFALGIGVGVDGHHGRALLIL
jgi:hypothetical protein